MIRIITLHDAFRRNLLVVGSPDKDFLSRAWFSGANNHVIFCTIIEDLEALKVYRLGESTSRGAIGKGILSSVVATRVGMISWDWLVFGSAATLESRQNAAMYNLQSSNISQLNGKWANRWSAVPVIHRKTLKTFRKGVLSDGNVNVDGVIIVQI